MAVRTPCLPLLLALLAGPASAQDRGVTIYRCTDAVGRLSLQDSPCAQGQSQQRRTMLQPVDPPAEAAPAPAPAAPVAADPAPRLAAAHAPRPMYECVRPDGSRYTSDDGGGDPRWVADHVPWPFLLLDGGGGVHGFAHAGTTAVAPARSSPPTRVDTASGGNGAPQLRFRKVSPPAPPPPPRPPSHHGHGHHAAGFLHGGGRWVRDECHALPQAEVCARLRDRREDIRDRRFNAQQRERERLAVEERGISARIAADCGGY